MRCKTYNVNISKKTCDCQHYQQSGCPCAHAVILIRKMNLSIKKSYFYEFCYVDQLENMFSSCQMIKYKSHGVCETVNKFAINLPFDDNVVDQSKSNDYMLEPMFESIAKNDTSTVSDKRYRCKGEPKKNTRNLRKIPIRINCKLCNKYISKTTRHPSSACVKYLKRQGLTPLVTLPIIEET